MAHALKLAPALAVLFLGGQLLALNGAAAEPSAPRFVCPANRLAKAALIEDLVYERDSCRVEARSFSSPGNFDGATRGIIYQVHTNVGALGRAAQVARRNLAASGAPVNIMLYTWRELWEQWNPAGETSIEGEEVQGLPVPHDSHPFTRLQFFDDMEVPHLGRVVAAETRAVNARPRTRKLGIMAHMYQAAIFLDAPFDLNLYAETDSCLCGDHLPFMFGLLDESTDILSSLDPSINGGGHTLLQVPNKFRERNSGWMLWKRSPKMSGMFLHYARLLSESFVRHYRDQLSVRDGQPALRDALYLWRNVIKEKLLSHETKVCRGWMAYGRLQKTCDNSDLSVGKGQVGAACAAGCMVAHERCECWVDRPLQGHTETAAEAEIRRKVIQEYSATQERQAGLREARAGSRKSRPLQVPGESAPMTNEEWAFWQAIQRPRGPRVRARARVTTTGEAAGGGAPTQARAPRRRRGFSQISQMGKWTFVPRDFVHRNPRMKRLTDSGVGTYFPGSKGKK
mmetsp:Transcript_37475/g.97266  ORF Transcript_37475/g.97266 Transcript_37475/m.97266 type:complete len:512 (-) Transcript_37475:191-1726(-)